MDVSVAYPARPDPGANKNFASLNYRYHIAAPKPVGGVFRTHTTLHSSRRPMFSDTFIPLSKSGTVEKWLAGAGASIAFTTDGDTCRRDVPHGAIVLCERRGNLWVLQIPGAGAWSKPYSASACERSVDARADAMLARDLARSAAACAEDQV